MNTTFIKTAASTVWSNMQKSSPAIMAGVAIGAGALALYTMAKAAVNAKDAVEEAKKNKARKIVQERRESAAERDDSEDVVVILDGEEIEAMVEDEMEKVELSIKETFAATWKAYLKPALWAAGSAACMCLSVYFGNKKVKAATAVAVAAQAMLSDRIKAEETILSGKKVQEITDALHGKRAQDAVAKIENDSLIPRNEGGQTLFVETTFTGQPFYDDFERVRAVINNLNGAINTGETVSVNDYLDALNLRQTTHYEEVGIGAGSRPTGICDGISELLRMHHTCTEVNIGGIVRPAIAIHIDNAPFTMCW